MIYDSNGKPVSSEMLQAKEAKTTTRVSGMVVSAKFRPEERSLMIQVRETETHRLSKPIQISASCFPFGHLDGAMEEFAKQLVNDRKIPLTLEFNPDDNTGEVSGYIA